MDGHQTLIVQVVTVGANLLQISRNVRTYLFLGLLRFLDGFTAVRLKLCKNYAAISLFTFNAPYLARYYCLNCNFCMAYNTNSLTYSYALAYTVKSYVTCHILHMQLYLPL